MFQRKSVAISWADCFFARRAWSAGFVSTTGLIARFDFAVSMSKKELRPHEWPWPQNSAVRETPISSVRVGRNVSRAPQKRVLLKSGRWFSMWSIKVTRRHGPTQRSHRVFGAAELARSRPIPGIGLALVDKIKLLSHPGPHHRSCWPSVTHQLPSLQDA